MRVAILTYNAQAGDAIGNQVAEKLALFLDRGADVGVVAESNKRLHPAVRPHCHVLREPTPHGDPWTFLASADLIIIEYGHAYRLLALLPLLAGGRRRILFDYHGVTPPDLWEGPNREVLEMGVQQRGLVWCADAALVHSRFTCQELRGPTAFPAERISVLEYPVDTKHLCPGRPRNHWRAQLGLRDVSFVLFVGRLAPNKRVRVLIDALDRLRDRRPRIHLLIVGDTTDVYQVEACRCQRQADELGLADRVHFVGQVRDDQLLDAYRSADLFVMPSRHEGFCIPLIEAMACGLPVVAARAGASPETIATAGLTFAVDDPDDLARQVRRVLRQPSLAEHLQRQGLLHAARHERSAWRERFGRIVDELLESPPLPRREQVEVRPRIPWRAVRAGSESLRVPVRVANRGTHAILSEGPGGMLLRSLVVDELGQPCDLPAVDTPLPELLVPGQEAAAMMRVPVPPTAGAYQVALFTVSPSADKGDRCLPAKSSFRLIVEPATVHTTDRPCADSLQVVHRALDEAQSKQQLPADYIDVTEGFLATCKRWIKNKLLSNFKHAYVDVLSRQQTAFNREILIALQELAECCVLLEHAPTSQSERLSPAYAGKEASSLAATIERTVAAGRAGELALMLQNLVDQLAEVRQRVVALETRLDELEVRESAKRGPMRFGA